MPAGHAFKGAEPQNGLQAAKRNQNARETMLDLSGERERDSPRLAVRLMRKGSSLRRQYSTPQK